MNLSEMKCTACRGDEPPLSDSQIEEYLGQLDGWEVDRSQSIPKLVKRFSFPDFRSALDFTISVGEAAEDTDHHPRITTEWGKVMIKWWTHKIKGLHQNDFIMAAFSDRLYEQASD
jgi:4a-hydroxytetrahydrobiopterin dehydratase